MSLNAALVDRARRLVDTPLAQRVEGTTQFTTLTGAWFKCRLTLSPSPEVNDAQGARSRVPHHATLLVARRDLDGNDLTINSTDRIEINSKQLGRMIFNATEDAQPIRKKRKILGWTVTLTRVEEHDFIPAVP